MNRMLATTLSLSAFALMLVAAAPSQAQVSMQPALSSLTFNAVAGLQTTEELYNQGVDAFNKGDIATAIAKWQAAIAKRAAFTDAHLNLGIAYAATQKYNEAITEFTWVINKTNPAAPPAKRADAFLERGRAQVELKQTEKALADFNEALTIKPTMFEVLPARAAAYFNAGQTDKAIADFNEYIAKNPKPEPSVYSNLGTVYLEKYKTSKSEADAKAALSAFDKYIAADPNSADGLLSRADANVALKDYAKAVTDYTAYLAKNPKDPDALAGRGRANMQLKKFPEAATDFKAALAIKSTPEMKINLGIAQLQAKDTKGAIDTLAGAVGNPPTAKDKPALNARAQAYLDVKDYPSAIKDYDALIKLDGKDTTSYYNRGVAYASAGNDEKAVADFNAYIAAPDAKDKALAYQGLGGSYMRAKKYAEAAAAYDKYVAAKPDDIVGLYNRGVAYYNIAVSGGDKSNYDKAIADLEAFLAKMPKDAQLVGQANKILPDAYLGSGKDATAALNKAIAANPKDATLLVNRGVLYLKQNPPQYDKAIADFTAAAAIDPKDATIFYNRAIAYAGKKDWANTVKDTTAALAIRPDYGDALITRADANFNNKAFPAATADYKQYIALAKTPDDKAYGLGQMANAALQAKDYPAATDALTQYIAVKPNDSTGLYRRGVAYLAASKFDEGIKDLTDFLGKPAPAELKPEEATAQKASALYNRGAAYMQKKDYEKAAADFEQSFATKADFAAATQAGLAYTKLGEATLDTDATKAAGIYAKAADSYSKAIGMGKAPTPKEMADAYYNKAVVLESKFKADETVDSLKQAVDSYAKYIEVGKTLTPPASDIADVQKQIEALKSKIAELS